MNLSDNYIITSEDQKNKEFQRLYGISLREIDELAREMSLPELKAWIRLFQSRIKSKRVSQGM